MTVVWWNGSVVGEDQAVVSVLDRGLVWGHGLFETMRSYGGRPWAFDKHYERLAAGAQILDVDIPAAAALQDAVDAVTRANSLSDCGLRVTVTAGRGPADPHADIDGPPNTLVTAWSLPDYSQLYARGASLVTMHGGGRALPGVKSTSYAVSIAGRIAARRAGADDALFVEAEGLVLETTGANLFAVFDDEMVTPPVAHGLLPGVTRMIVLEVAADLGLRTREEPVWIDDLFAADEVLLTSTLREVYPVGVIDGRPLEGAGLAARLRRRLRERISRELGGRPAKPRADG